MITYLRLVDWGWVWVVAACCAFLGGLKAFDEAVMHDIPSQDTQTFLLLLDPESTPKERMQLRSQFVINPMLRQAKWLEPEEVLQRAIRQDLPAGEFELIRQQMPQVVEVTVPTRFLLEETFNPGIFDTFPVIDRYLWNENAVSYIQEERIRWELRSQKLQLLFLIASAVITVVAFVFHSQRNQLLVLGRRSGKFFEADRIHADTLVEAYSSGLQAWLRVMVVQAVVVLLLALFLFVAFDQILGFLSDASPQRTSLASGSDWRFLWLAASMGFIGKFIDLLRGWHRLSKIKRP